MCETRWKEQLITRQHWMLSSFKRNPLQLRSLQQHSHQLHYIPQNTCYSSCWASRSSLFIPRRLLFPPLLASWQYKFCGNNSTGLPSWDDVIWLATRGIAMSRLLRDEDHTLHCYVPHFCNGHKDPSAGRPSPRAGQPTKLETKVQHKPRIARPACRLSWDQTVSLNSAPSQVTQAPNQDFGQGPVFWCSDPGRRFEAVWKEVLTKKQHSHSSFIQTRLGDRRSHLCQHYSRQYRIHEDVNRVNLDKHTNELTCKMLHNLCRGGQKNNEFVWIWRSPVWFAFGIVIFRLYCSQVAAAVWVTLPSSMPSSQTGTTGSVASTPTIATLLRYFMPWSRTCVGWCAAWLVLRSGEGPCTWMNIMAPSRELSLF